MVKYLPQCVWAFIVGGINTLTAEKIAPDLQSAIIRVSEKAAADSDAASVNTQQAESGAPQDAVYEKLRRAAEEMYGASDAATPEISAQGADSNTAQAFDGVDAPSTSMQFMAAENYTPERRKTIREYLQAANREFSAFVERVKRGEKTRPWFNLGGVNERAAADVQRLTGVDVRGYANSITPNDVRHIVRRHGENGVADHSMRDVNDLARIEYVLQNYDDAELVDEKTKTVTNKDQSPALLVKFSKKIDGTYYVVEAVPDSSAQRLRVLSAYISAKKSDHGLQNKQSLQITPEATIPYSADTYNISQAEGESQEDGENLQLRAEEMRARGMREVERFASEIGGAGREAFIGRYSPEMNAAEYIQGMNDYYTAGKRGAAFSDVQSRYSANLSQIARETAYFAGQVDAKALANAEKNGYTDSRNTKTEELENGRRNQGSGRGGQRSDSLDSVQSGRSVQTGTSAVESGQTSQRQRAESIRTAVHAQRPVSTGSQGLATGTSAKTLRIVPASMWTDDMRAAVREQSKRGRQVIYFTGELEFHSGKGERFQARGALARDGKRMWVKADHDTLTIEQIIRHEEYHALVKRDPKLRERTRETIVKEHGEAELEALAQAYVDLYGWTDADMNDVFEEIMADAYAGIDVFDGLGDLKSAVEYGDAVRREAGQSEAAYAADGQTKFSREPDVQAYADKFSAQIDGWMQGMIPKSGYFDLGMTSPSLAVSGADHLPIVMSENVIQKFTSDYGHEIALSEAKKLPLELQDPVFVFEGSVQGSLVAVTEINDKNGDEVIVAIHLNKKQNRLLVNRIASVYGKRNIENYVLNNINAGKLKNASNKKAPNWFTNRGLQLPKLVQTILDADTSIAQADSRVNRYSMQKNGKDAGGIKTSRERMNTDDDSGRIQQIDAESTGRISQTEEYARGTESAGRTGRKNEEVGAFERIRERHGRLDTSFGEKPIREWAIGHIVAPKTDSYVYNEQQKLFNYGIPSFVIEDSVFVHNHDLPAFTAQIGQVYLREHFPNEYVGNVAAAEHEATHVMRVTGYKPYLDFLNRVPDMIIFHSDATSKIADLISQHTGVDIFNATPKQLEKFFDEINAGMYGHIANGQTEELRAIYGDAFKDFDAYVRELTDIHERFKRENGRKAKTSREATHRDIARTLSKMTPAQIALLTREDANTTPPLPHRADSGIDEHTGKKSKFADSVAKSENVLDVAKALINDVSDIRYYYGISNLDTLDAANERLNAGGAEETIKWYNIEPGHATAEDVALGFILLKRYQDAGMYDDAVEVIRHLREIGTEAGQTVQAFSILGRLTPEGMAVYAQKELDQALAEMIDKRGEAWAEKHKAMFQLTAEEAEDIRAKIIAASKLPDGRDKNVLLAQIAHTVEAKLPTNILRQIKAFSRISMLLNTRTMIRNVVVHPVMMPVNAVQDFIGAGIDRALSKQSGVRTTGLLKPSISALKKGVFESYDDFRKHINTREIPNDRFEIGNGADFHHYTKADIAAAGWPRKGTMVLSDVLNTVDRVTNFLLDVGDRPFYEMYFINSLNNQMRLNHASEPTANMIDIATTEALKRTWQDDNAFTRGMANLRKTLNVIGSDLVKLGNAEFGIGNFVLAFVKTPANLIRATVEYSPAGFIDVLKTRTIVYSRSVKSKQFDPQTQKALVDALSKAITGTLVMIIGGFLARAGLITGSDDDKDKDLAAFEQNIMGIAPYSVRINGKSYSYGWAQPISTSFAVGADVALNYNKDDALVDIILNAVKTGGNTVFEQSFLKGLQDLFGTSGVVPGLINVISGGTTQFVSTSLGQIAQMADPYARTSYEYGNILQTTANKVKAKVPGARNTLAPVVDVLGHDVLSNGGENKALNVFLNPANVYTKTATQAAEEIYRVYGETGDVTVIPRKAPYYLDYKGTRYTFTSFERADYQRTAGQSNEKIVHDLLNLKGYTALDDDTKAKALNLTVEYANALAKYTYLKEQDMDFERDGWMENAENGADFGVSVAEFILAKAVVSDIKRGLKDKDTGETIDNSKGLLIMEALYGIPGLIDGKTSDEKRMYLFEALGVGSGIIEYDREGVQDELADVRWKAGQID